MIRALLARLFRRPARPAIPPPWHPSFHAAIALHIDAASPGGLL